MNKEKIKTLAQAVLHNEADAIKKLAERTASSSEDMNVADILAKFTQRRELMRLYIDAYRRYCWPVTSLDDFKLAPFHVLATEGRVHDDGA